MRYFKKILNSSIAFLKLRTSYSDNLETKKSDKEKLEDLLKRINLIASRLGRGHMLRGPLWVSNRSDNFLIWPVQGEIRILLYDNYFQFEMSPRRMRMLATRLLEAADHEENSKSW